MIREASIQRQNVNTQRGGALRRDSTSPVVQIPTVFLQHSAAEVGLQGKILIILTALGSLGM